MELWAFDQSFFIGL